MYTIEIKSHFLSTDGVMLFITRAHEVFFERWKGMPI